jgi:GNAT superfamily N-acetyltransferase
MAAISIRGASQDDVPAMARLRDACAWTGGAGELTMQRYLAGAHHPQHARAPRAAFIAEVAGQAIGFIAGHVTARFECDGELQWMLVAPAWRGGPVSNALLRSLAQWFAVEGARRFYGRHGAIDLSEFWMVWPDIRVADVRAGVANADPPA